MEKVNQQLYFNFNIVLSLKYILNLFLMEAGERAQQLKAMDDLPEELGLVPRTHIVSQNYSFCILESALATFMPTYHKLKK